MNSAVLPAVSADELPGYGLLLRAARALQLVMLTVIYGGAIVYLSVLSPLLLYGAYALLLACLAVCMFYDWPLTRELRAVAPYLLFVFGYFLWGMIVNPEASLVKEGARTYFKNLLVLTTMALVLDRGTLRTFAGLVQMAVLGNVALSVWEVFDPDLVAALAYSRDPDATAFNILRPAGLWSNPDETAFALIFGLLLSRWAKGPLAWAGRAAAVLGLYLAASRTGLLLLVMCAAGFGVQWLRENRVTSARLAGGSLFALLALGAVVVASARLDLEDHWQVQRMFDFSENSRNLEYASRGEIAETAARTALNGPWYGSGLYSFQSEDEAPSVLKTPAHNVFLVVWGEAGVLVGLAYLGLLAFGLGRVWRQPLPGWDRVPALLCWLSYLIIGLTWHNQFTSFAGMFYIGLLWCLPHLLARRESHEVTA